MKFDLRIKKLRDNAQMPTYGSEFAAGADMYAAIDEAVTVEPGETKFIPTGLAFEIPEGYAGFVYARSGLASKRGLAPANKVGVIDADYRGEVMVALHNHSKEPQTVEAGERIAQMIIAPFVAVNYVFSDELDDTVRGEGGFGSTGRK
jgi:dUTP pyrophosphatase